MKHWFRDRHFRSLLKNSTYLGLSRGVSSDNPVMNASINRFSVQGGVLSLQSWGEVAHLQRGVLDELG